MDSIRTLFGLATAAVIVGCGGTDPVGPNFHRELSSLGGCGDVVFYAVDADDRLMLSFRADGLVGEARAPGEPTVTTFQLPDPPAELILEQGTRVSDVMCDDVAENGGPQVQRTWTATAGSATVTVRLVPEPQNARADLLLEDVVLESDGDRVTLDRLEWTDTPVGWFPG